MTGKHIITDGCEFQSDCIEYKDISYLKIMPICAIHELSIACHDKVNKCKYYTLYRQLKQKEQECEELHSRTASIIYSLTGGRLSYSTYTLEGCEQAYHDQLEIDVERATKELQEENETLKQEVNKYKQALDEIEKYLDAQQKYFDGEDYHNLLDIINKVKGETDEES